MQHVYGLLDATPYVVLGVIAIAIVVALVLAERVVGVLEVRRTRKADRTFWDKPRRFDDMRRRVRGDDLNDIGDGY